MWKNEGQPRGVKKVSVGKKNLDLFKMSLFGQGLSEDSERRGYSSSQCGCCQGEASVKSLVLGQCCDLGIDG